MQAQLAKVAEMREKASAQKLLTGIREIGGVNYVAGMAQAEGMDELRSVADLACNKVERAVVVLGAVNGDKVNLVVKASKEAVAKGIHAGKIIKEAAKVIGGGGGGRPDMAQAGGKDPESLPKAFEKAAEMVQSQLSVN